MSHDILRAELVKTMEQATSSIARITELHEAMQSGKNDNGKLFREIQVQQDCWSAAMDKYRAIELELNA